MGSPIAYTYNADAHCPTCAERAHGRDEHGDIAGGAPEVGAIAPWDEWYANELHEGAGRATLACGTCGAVIEDIEL